MADPDGPIFANLDPDDPEKGTMQLESMCPNCHETGMTRMMLTNIPYFREIIISSFSCDECNHSNRHMQFGGRIQDKGVKCIVNVKTKRDLDRQVIRSDSATFSIPELEFGNPPGKMGEITTIEGLLDGAVRGLNQEQPLRHALEPDLAKKIDVFVEKLEKLKDLNRPFTIELDDPSGNSHIENPMAPLPDEHGSVTEYVRSRSQDEFLCLVGEEDGESNSNAEGGDSNSQAEGGDSNSQAEGGDSNDQEGSKGDDDNELDLKQEVLSFPANCPCCNSPAETNMKVVNIPFFKEVVIMATTCDSCGLRENEVKAGAGIADLGTCITLKVTDTSDLSRDVLKSDTCAVRIPDIELELSEGTLGGRFTTVEGLLVQIKDELQTKNPFFMGDGAACDTKKNMDIFIDKLDKLISGETKNFTFILDDPAGNSYVQNLYAPDPDPEMSVEKYTRNQDQNDTLGILDMKTENYAEKS